jgi:hypothetical protein
MVLHPTLARWRDLRQQDTDRMSLEGRCRLPCARFKDGWCGGGGGRGDNGARSLLKQGMAGKAWGAGPVRSCHAEEQGTGAGMTHTRARGG